MAENNTSNIGFEKQIWDAACVLRGNIDASEYKSVVLGLIFLKYISDRCDTDGCPPSYRALRQSTRNWLKKAMDLKRIRTNTLPKTSSLSLRMHDGVRLLLPLTRRKLAR